jgi:predicted acetyltransferase
MTSEIAVRICTPADWPGFIETMTSAFGSPMTDEGRAQWERVIDFSKMLVATDHEAGRETVVGTAGWLPFDMTLPGGEIPVAGVTMVTVRPTHRRRGVLRQLMRQTFDDLHAQGLAVATLWASESVIYQRFGYGIGAYRGGIEIDRGHGAFLGHPAPVGSARLIGRPEALELFPDVYERARRSIPGSFKRTPLWWDARALPEHPPGGWRGGNAVFRMILEIDGRPEGYAFYRMEPDWARHGLPNGSLDVLEAIGTTPVATREVWRYLFSVDLTAKVGTYRLGKDHPLFLMLEDPRQLRTWVRDGTWVRLVDAAAALAARRYGHEGALTFELLDPFCPWNEGIWTLEAGPDGAALHRSTASAELRLSAAELSAIYLGTIPCTGLLQAGRLEELAPGAAHRADLLFHSDVPPWCLDDF